VSKKKYFPLPGRISSHLKTQIPFCPLGTEFCPLCQLNFQEIYNKKTTQKLKIYEHHFGTNK
jgi:hypothetical protein